MLKIHRYSEEHLISFPQLKLYILYLIIHKILLKLKKYFSVFDFIWMSNRLKDFNLTLDKAVTKWQLPSLIQSSSII